MSTLIIQSISNIHIGPKSRWISQHHINWRLRAINSITEKKQGDSLHFSSILAVSEADGQKIKETILQAMEDAEKIIQPSPEETAFCMGIDFFRL